MHGIFDYIGGAALLFLPNLLGFADAGGAAVMVPRVLGVMVLLQALCTRFELGLFKVLPMRMHLMVDYIAAIFLALSPWLFRFNHLDQRYWMPHVVIGISVFLVTLMTEREPRITVGSTPTHRPA